MKRIGGAALLLSSIFLISTPVSSAPAPAASAAKTRQEWTQIASDKKYGKLFSPSRVKVESSVNGVATRIGAWIKTSYTVEGARETIEAYGIEKSIPDPGKLSYSVGYVEVVPQERKLFYVKEDFYDAEGNALWSTVYEPPKEHEINHRKFEEDYYVAIVDRVFHHGEREQKDSEDRWKHLWEKQSGGRTTHAYGDMTTMRLSGDNLIYWEFQETKDSEGNTVEVHFLKKALNPGKGAEKVIKAQVWTLGKGWEDVKTDGRYVTISKGDPAYEGLERLRAIVKGYQYWLNRYRTDLPKKPSAKKN